MKNKITIILVFIALLTTGKVNAESYGGHYSWTEDHHILLSYISNNKQSLLSYLIGAYDKSKSYRSEIERVFMTEGVPTELIALAAIESNFSPNAVSHAGAVGMWQFMPNTGSEIGLEINSKIDERRNWKKSTVAAARYLKHLAEDHFDNNYELAILAYNAGLGNVKRAIRKTRQRIHGSLYKTVVLFIKNQENTYLKLFQQFIYSVILTKETKHNLLKKTNFRIDFLFFIAIIFMQFNEAYFTQRNSIDDLH